jgi:hypothetical protein
LADDPTPTSRPSIDRPAPISPVAWAAITAVAVAVLGIVVLVAATPAAVDGDPTVDVAARLCLILAVGAGTAVAVAPLPRKTRAWAIAFLAGLYLFAGAALVLSGSSFPPLGIALDQGFRTASITKYAHSVALVDFAYKGLPPYYPPLFFWVLGRFARWTDSTSYEALKIGVLATGLVIPLVTVRLWAAVTRDWVIALAIVVTGLGFTDWYEPYGWLAAVLFVPWFLLFVLQVGRGRDLTRRQTAVGILVGAVVLGTYYYPLFIGAVALLGLLGLRRVAETHGVRLPPMYLRRTLVVLAGTAVLTAVFWLPLLVSVLTTSGARAYQNRYLDPATVDIPLPFLTFDLVGIVMLFGLGYLALTARRSPGSLGLLAVVVGAYVWIALGDFGILVGAPLLTVKTLPVIEVSLLAAAGAGAVVTARRIRDDPRVRGRVGRAGLLLGGVTVGVVVAVGLGQSAITAIPYVKDQRAARPPSTMLAEFTVATHGHVADTVVLTDVEQLPELLPVFVFNVWNAHYANPASQFDERTRFLRRLSHETDPHLFAAALAANRYDAVDSVAFRTSDDGRFSYMFLDDAFPRGVVQRTFTFLSEQFDPQWFRRVDGRQLTVFVPRGAPLRGLTRSELAELRRRFPGDLEGRATS